MLTVVVRYGALDGGKVVRCLYLISCIFAFSGAAITFSPLPARISFIPIKGSAQIIPEVNCVPNISSSDFNSGKS